MTLNDILYKIYGQQNIIVYEKLNRKENLYNGKAYYIGNYEQIRQRKISSIYAVDVIENGIKIPTIMIEVE